MLKHVIDAVIVANAAVWPFAAYFCAPDFSSTPRLAGIGMLVGAVNFSIMAGVLRLLVLQFPNARLVRQLVECAPPQRLIGGALSMLAVGATASLLLMVVEMMG